MKIKFNETGTHIHKGKLKVRLDIYPDETCKTYLQQYVDVFARKLTEEESETIDLGKGAFQYTQEALSLQKSVPTKKQLNPFLCHFISIDPDMTKGELKDYIKTTFDKKTMEDLDDVLSVNNRQHELYSILKNKCGNGKKVKSINKEELKNRFIDIEEVI